MTILKTGSKINLGLKISGRREDGYHEIESFFYPLSWPRDELRLEPIPGADLRLECENCLIAPLDNIISKAYSAFAGRAGQSPGLYCHLRKNVPIGAGLGGGSADAAFFLQWLNDYCGSALSHSQLWELAAEIGADVPFFLLNRPAIVRGKGEITAPAAFNGENFYLVAVWPEIHVNTAWAFAEWDKLKLENALTYPQGKVKNFILSSGEINLLALDLHNDLEQAVFAAHPGLADIRERFMRLGAVHAAMSGSGSTVYGLFQDSGMAREAARKLLFQHRHVYFTRLENAGM